MSRAADIFDAAGEKILYTFGVNGGGSAASFTPAGGTTVTLDVVFEEETRNVAEGYGAQVFVQIYTIDALLSDLGAEPDKGDVFLIDSTTYTVDAVLENDGTWVKVAVR